MALVPACGSSSGSGGGQAASKVRKLGHDSCGNTVNSCAELTLDAEGRVLTSTVYQGMVGMNPSNCSDCVERDVFTYGKGLEPLTEKIDDNCDGSINSGATYTYDSKGRVVTAEYDNDGNGTVDAKSCFSFSTNGNDQLERLDEDCDGTYDQCWARTRDANGLILTESEKGVDCNFNTKCRTYQYDSGGKVTLSTYDGACDGTVQKVCYSYVKE